MNRYIQEQISLVIGKLKHLRIYEFRYGIDTRQCKEFIIKSVYRGNTLFLLNLVSLHHIVLEFFFSGESVI